MDRTVALTNQYIHGVVPLDGETSTTPLGAVSLIGTASKNLQPLRSLKAMYDPVGSRKEDYFYRKLLASIVVILNFYESVAQLQRQKRLDEPLIMAYFAKPFLDVFEAMLIVNAELAVVDPSRFDQLADFKKACEDFEQEGKAK